jgi:hypothetical protein
MQKLIGGCQLDSSVGNAHARNLRDINNNGVDLINQIVEHNIMTAD